MKKYALLKFLFLISSSSLASGLTCHDIFLNSAESTIKIDILMVENRKHLKLLKTSIDEMLKTMKDEFILPNEIFMVNAGKAPEYNEGMIHMRFPYKSFDADGQPFTKSAKDSLGIHLHELVHQIFETSLQAWYSKSPEILWSFFARADGVAGEQSLIDIGQAKIGTRYQHMSDRKILEKFIAYAEISKAYNELFADTMTVFFLKDPDAIYRSVQFKQYNLGNELRRFGEPHSIDEAKTSAKEGPHGVLAPVRNFLWSQVFSEYKTRHPQVSTGAALRRIAQTIVLSVKQVTHDFEKPASKISVEEMNRNLISNLKAEFKDEPY